MEFDELTQVEQDSYNAFMSLMRPLFGNWESLMRWVEDISTLWANEISAIHAKLDAGAIIPDNTGYPNSSPIAKADMTAALAAISAMESTYHTLANTGYAITMVGPENIHDPASIG